LHSELPHTDPTGRIASKLHPLEVKAIADGDAEQGIKGPIRS
jgi:hypothetical protein